MQFYVAPLAGAWIEIVESCTEYGADCRVAPLAGAWIEIAKTYQPAFLSCRSPRGSVD